MSHGHAELGETTPRSTFYERGRFGRMFPTLPPFAPDTPAMRRALAELGAPGGPMDAADDLSDPVSLITNAEKSKNNPDNPRLPAGSTFVGQFLDHDLTFDPTSSLARRQDPEAIRNFRIPALDLDSVYGGGPARNPYLYDRGVDSGRTSFLVEEINGSGTMSVDHSVRYDLPRNSQSVALLGDPRNDENLVVSQLHVAMLRLHNKVVRDVKDDFGPGYTDAEVFSEAQRIVRWHYQWMILHEFLPGIVGDDTAARIADKGLQHYRWNHEPFIPVEFSVGAYRFGHSQVRPSYRANFGTSADDPSRQFIGFIVDARVPDSADPPDLRGGKRAARRFVDWQTFFDFKDGQVRRSKTIDTRLSQPLFSLMGQPAGEPTSLATRNLVRNLTMQVPSGQRVARALGLEPLAREDLSDVSELRLDRRTPLWFYVLREAQVQHGGEHLGAVGGQIVAEVIRGLIVGDRQSYLRQDTRWQPTYGRRRGEFTMTDLLREAEVVADVPSVRGPESIDLRAPDTTSVGG